VAGTTDNPYVGPRPFERDDRPFFFGRSAEARELLSLVVAERAVLLYAASGAGKTSLLHAALVPLLEEEEGFETLPIARIRAALPDDALAAARNVYTAGVLSSLVEGEADDVLQLTLAQFLEARPHTLDAQGFPAPRALIIDQFEEFFTAYAQYWHQRDRFIGDLNHALEADPLLRVVLAIREDYVAQLDPFEPMLPRQLRTRFHLERLGAEAALAAVVSPTRATARTYAPGVAEKLVRDLLRLRIDTGRAEPEEVEGEYVEPVQLQVACQSLWDGLPPDVAEITEEHLRTFGDVDEVLRRFYDGAAHAAAVRARMSERRLRERVEESFITAVGTRNTVYRTETQTGGLPNAAIDELESRRVVRAEWRAGARWYELTHDRLIGPIQTSNARFRGALSRRRRRIALAIVAAAVVLGAIGLAVALPRGGGGAKPALAVSVDAIALDVPNPVARAGPATGTAATVHLATENLAGKTVLLKPVLVSPGAPDRFGASVPVPVTAPERSTATVTVWVPRPRVPGVYGIAVLAGTVGGGPTGRTRSASFRIPNAGAPARAAATSSALTIAAVGLGTVSASGTQPCPPACSYVYSRGTTVSLTALPEPHGRFVGWRGCRSETQSCRVRVAGSTNVTALFTWRTHVVGHTSLGHRITAIEIGNPRSRRKVLVVGCVRQRECQGQVIIDALTKATAVPDIDLWAIPNLNPDHRGDYGVGGISPNKDFPCSWAQRSVYSTHCRPLRVPSEPEARAAFDLVKRLRPALSVWYFARERTHPQSEVEKKHPAWVDRVGGPMAQRVEQAFARLVGLPFEGAEQGLEPYGGYPGSATFWQAHAFPDSVPFWVELHAGKLPAAAAKRHARAILTIAGNL
jgi:hypothetical protein